MLKSSSLPGLWKTLLENRFEIRAAPNPAPVPSPLSQAQPLWHNQYLSVHYNFVDSFTKWHSRYARTMAILGFTNVNHIHEASTSPGGLVQQVQSRLAVQGNLYCRPTTKWLESLTNTVKTFGQVVPPDPKPYARWLIR